MNPSLQIHVSSAMEGRFLGNRGIEFQSDVMEEGRVPEVSSATRAWKVKDGH
jgi:hypothetical protein